MKKEREVDSPLGLLAFESLRTEDEPWLDAGFVFPQDFALMARNRSAVIFGRRGSGKTALYHALVNCCTPLNEPPSRLLVEWRPIFPTVDNPTNLSVVQEQVKNVFDACATALLLHLIKYPDTFSAASSWAQDVLRWFVQRYGGGDLRSRLEPYLSRKTLEDISSLDALLSSPSPEVFSPNSPLELVATKLTDALSAIGLDGIWVLVDGSGGKTVIDPEPLTLSLTSFLSTLPLFERAEFTYKLIVPFQIETRLLRAAALARHYVEGYRLTWDTPLLKQIVERRLAMAMGCDVFTLGDLYEQPEHLLSWLERSGGDSPREWLDQIRPLITFYIENQCNCPINLVTWKALRCKYPPRIYLDETGRQFVIGGRMIPLEALPTKAYEMLIYLYQHLGQTVNKADLYFQAYLGLQKTPGSPFDERYEAPNDYEGLVDTTLWRLRQVIEPDPADPVLLITVRGHGICLRSRW